jgi:hypothetical protein
VCVGDTGIEPVTPTVSMLSCLRWLFGIALEPLVSGTRAVGCHGLRWSDSVAVWPQDGPDSPCLKIIFGAVIMVARRRSATRQRAHGIKRRVHQIRRHLGRRSTRSRRWAARRRRGRMSSRRDSGVLVGRARSCPNSNQRGHGQDGDQQRREPCSARPRRSPGRSNSSSSPT